MTKQREAFDIIEALTYWRNVANSGRGSAMTASLHSACDWIEQNALSQSAPIYGPTHDVVGLDEVAEISKEAWDSLKQSAPQGEAVCTLGVGDGSGQLFVHGSYDAIKACQALILRATPPAPAQAANVEGLVQTLLDAHERYVICELAGDAPNEIEWSDALNALLAAYRAPQWRGISEAPVTATKEDCLGGDFCKKMPCLVYSPLFGVRDGELHRLWQEDAEPHVHVSNLHGNAVTDWGVTHYMPLPATPQNTPKPTGEGI